MPLIAKETEKDHNVYKFFGIKLKIKSFSKYKRLASQMELFKKQIKTLTDSSNIMLRKYVFWMAEDKFTTKERVWALSQKFYKQVGYYPNFKNPVGFNEKINWMKLNYYDPNQKFAIDKYEFKKYIRERLGDGYTIPLIGVYEDVNDIDFDSLPQKFVIKTTTGWGATSVEIVKDKSKLDIDFVKARFSNLMQQWNNYYYLSLPSGYKDIDTKIIIEEYVEQIDGQLYDYKFMCFHGEPKWVLACSNRSRHTAFENYDLSWNLFTPSPKSAKRATVQRPKNFDRMVEIAKILSKEFPLVRVDFYEVGDKVYVGELTFTPNGGFNTYSSDWNCQFGEWLDLSKLNPEYLHILPEFAQAAKKFLSSDIVDAHIINEDAK